MIGNFCDLFQVAKLFEGENDRVKLFTLLCGDEDEKVIRAASGALAVLTTSELVCRKILQVLLYVVMPLPFSKGGGMMCITAAHTYVLSAHPIRSV